MPHLGQVRKAGLAVLALAARVTLTSGATLLRCPFLQREAEIDCCSRSQHKKCPLSSTLETCPYYVTESKFGLAQGEDEILPRIELSLVAPFAPAATSSGDHHFESVGRDGAGLHLKNRVLRI